MFSEVWEGENAAWCRDWYERERYSHKVWFNSFQALILSAVDAIQNRLDNVICSEEIREKHRNKEDKYYCQATTCENCRNCNLNTVSKARIFLLTLKRYSKNEYALSERLAKDGGRRQLENQIKTVMHELE